MTPTIAFIIAVWAGVSPAQPNERAIMIWRDVFPDAEICQTALDTKMVEAAYYYRKAPKVHLVGDCQPYGGSL